MANLNDKQSPLPLTLPVVLVVPGPRISDQPLSEENKWLLFDRAWTLLAPAVERDGEHTKSSVLAALAKGEKRLWVSEKSAFITTIRTYPTGLKVGHAWLAGGDLKEILSWVPMLEDWCRARGAKQARVDARRGWAKVLGYKEFRTTAVKEL